MFITSTLDAHDTLESKMKDQKDSKDSQKIPLEESIKYPLCCGCRIDTVKGIDTIVLCDWHQDRNTQDKCINPEHTMTIKDLELSLLEIQENYKSCTSVSALTSFVYLHDARISRIRNCIEADRSGRFAKKFCEYNGILIIVRLLKVASPKLHCQHDEIFTILWEACPYYIPFEKSIKNDLYDVILNALKNSDDHIRLRDLVFRVLAWFSPYDHRKDTELTNIVLDLMIRYPENVSLQGNACKYLAKQRYHDNHVEIIRSDVCTKTIIAAMNNYANYYQIQESGSEIFVWSLKDYSADVYDTVYECIIAAMNNFPDNIRIQITGLAYFHTMLNNGAGKTRRERADEIIEENGLQMIMKKMEYHSEHSEIQHNACELLFKIVSHAIPEDFDQDDEDNEGCIDLICDTAIYILKALKNHSDDRMIHFEAWTTLTKYACTIPKTRQVILDQGGITLLFHTIDVFLSDHTVVEQALALVYILVENSEKTRLTTEKYLSNLLRVIREHNLHRNILKYARAIISTMTIDAYKTDISKLPHVLHNSKYFVSVPIPKHLLAPFQHLQPLFPDSL